MFNYIRYFIISVVFAGSGGESVDGEYIMSHIQDQVTFEIFNPFDWNDNNFGKLTKDECESIVAYKKEKIKEKNGKIIRKLVDVNATWHGNPSDPDSKANCGDNYYFTKKVMLTQDWNNVKNVPLIGKYLNWTWNPGKDPYSVTKDSGQKLVSKQLIMMFLACLVIISLFVFGYNKNKKVQTGLGNLLEVFVIFMRDEVVYPNMGEKQGKKFLPLILTFFFFIVMLNLLGLIPGSATSTAFFSTTVALALITFFTYIIFGNKDFWKHIFATPGVPFWLLPIMVPVELIGLLTKPFALSVRLLANMNAGHIIIMAFIGIIINMKSPWVALGSVPMALAINMLEIFVAFLQGYIFSLLSSIFIGMAVTEHEHH